MSFTITGYTLKDDSNEVSDIRVYVNVEENNLVIEQDDDTILIPLSLLNDFKEAVNEINNE